MGERGGLPQEENGVGDPGILVDQNTGEIFVSAVWMWGKPGKHQWVEDGSEPGYEIAKSAQFMMVRSMDDGLSLERAEEPHSQAKEVGMVALRASTESGHYSFGWHPRHADSGRDKTGYPFSNITHSATMAPPGPLATMPSAEATNAKR